MISRRGRNNGRPAFICGQSPQETCHCQRVERPSQSHKPHPNPLLAKEREEESVLSPRERVRERADLGGLEAKSCRLGFLPQQNSEGHGMIDLDLSSGLTHPLTSPPLKGGDMERLSISGLKDKFNFFSGTLPKRTYSPNCTSAPRKRKAAYTLTEIVIVMLIISVIVAVTIGVTKAKLDKITSYTYTTAYLTLRDVTRNIFADFSYTDEDYILTNNPLSRLFSYIYPPAAASQTTPATGDKVYYQCAEDTHYNIDNVSSSSFPIHSRFESSLIPVYENLEDVDCSSVPKWFEEVYVGYSHIQNKNYYFRYVKCPGKAYIDDIMGRSNEYWDFGPLFYSTYTSVNADASAEEVENELKESCTHSCRDGVNNNCGPIAYGLYPSRFTCGSTINGEYYKTQMIESQEETLDHWPVCKLTPFSPEPDPEPDPGSGTGGGSDPDPGSDPETGSGDTPVVNACELPDDSEIRPQYCKGKTFDSTPGVCAWKDITPWPPECPEGQEWNNAEVDCRCVQIARTLPRSGENFCKMFAERTNTKSGTTDCSGSSISSDTTDFKDKTADITLRNGMLLYNVRQNPQAIPALANNKQGGSYDGVDNTNSYGYTVYVDVNGKQGDSKLWEDVYPFYITMSGLVVAGYDKDANPEGAGGDNSDHMQVSVQSEFIDYNGTRKINWLERSVPFQTGACRSGYVGQNTPYCNGITTASTCTAVNANCRIKYISPVKFF